MFKLIDSILQEFKVYFNRKSTFYWFITIIFGMIIREDLRGVTSIIGALMIDPKQYYNMLHFYKSTAYKLEDLKRCWIKIVINRVPLKTLDGNILGVGDHSKIVKEGRYIPAVKKHHQESDNAGKGEYIYGHEVGMIGVLSDSPNMKCIGLDIEIHDGIDEVKSIDAEAKVEKSTSAIKLMSMVERLMFTLCKPLIMLLDAGFSNGDVFKKAKEINTKLGNILLTIITRAKSHYVACESEPVAQKRSRGRPRKNVDGNVVITEKSINLINLFETEIHKFTAVNLILYGKVESIQYLCLNLFWKPAEGFIRFVMVKTGDKKMVLMCSNLALNPETIIMAYCCRFKIEVAFKELKHNLGSFYYHFWTKAMPKLSKFKTKTDLTGIIDKCEVSRILFTTRAIEVFMFQGCVALGIISIVANTFPEVIWRNFSGWIRTHSSEIPSIQITRNVIQKIYIPNIQNLSIYATYSIISKFQVSDPFNYDEQIA